MDYIVNNNLLGHGYYTPFPGRLNSFVTHKNFLNRKQDVGSDLSKVLKMMQVTSKTEKSDFQVTEYTFSPDAKKKCTHL